MPLSFRRRLRPFGIFFEKIGRKIGEAVVKGSGFVEKGLGKVIPITETILGIAERVPVPSVQLAARFGREAVGFAKGVRRGAEEVEKFSRKLTGKRGGGAKARKLIRQSETIK